MGDQRSHMPQIIGPIESPVLRPTIPNAIPCYTKRRNALCLVLLLSLSVGTSLAIAGAEAFDQFNMYLHNMRYDDVSTYDRI